MTTVLDRRTLSDCEPVVLLERAARLLGEPWAWGDGKWDRDRWEWLQEYRAIREDKRGNPT